MLPQKPAPNSASNSGGNKGRAEGKVKNRCCSQWQREALKARTEPRPEKGNSAGGTAEESISAQAQEIQEALIGASITWAEKRQEPGNQSSEDAMRRHQKPITAGNRRRCRMRVR